MATTKMTPYLLFDGRCGEAMGFYQTCFGGRLDVTLVRDSPARDHMPLVNQEKVLHSHLLSGEIEVSASDWLALNHTIARGNSVCLFIQSLSIKSIKKIFSSLSEGAEITDPLSKTFFGTYGALNDRFGVRWMFQSEE